MSSPCEARLNSSRAWPSLLLNKNDFLHSVDLNDVEHGARHAGAATGYSDGPHRIWSRKLLCRGADVDRRSLGGSTRLLVALLGSAVILRTPGLRECGHVRRKGCQAGPSE